MKIFSFCISFINKYYVNLSESIMFHVTFDKKNSGLWPRNEAKCRNWMLYYKTSYKFKINYKRNPFTCVHMRNFDHWKISISLNYGKMKDLKKKSIHVCTHEEFLSLENLYIIKLSKMKALKKKNITVNI